MVEAVVSGAVRVLIAVTVLLMAPGFARATCSFSSGASTTLIYTVPGTISVARDVPDGTVLGRYQTTTDAFAVRCTGDPVGVVNVVGPTPGVNQTLIPIGSTGISWRWAFRARNFFEASYGSRTLNTTESVGRVTTSLELVKTGLISAGTILPAGELGRQRYGSLDARALRLGNAVVVAAPSCSTSDVQVSLGARSAGDFTGIGSSSSPVAFSIGLDCAGGIGTIRYRVDPSTTVVNSTQSVVALDAGSGASGVGVQLLNGAGTEPLPLAVLQPFTGYMGAGAYSIPLRARYYQTAATVTGGGANSSMTFTLSYE